MKKVLFFAAMALVALASCSDETFVGDVTTAPQDNSPSETNAIVFSSASKGITRADFEGAEAAQKLGNKFVVFGYKGETTGTPGSTVFDNYLVKYTQNTANTTESNSKNWEYVLQNVSNDQTYEYVPIPHATSHGITQQTIKYWDYSQPQYDFFAWSTGTKTAIYGGTTADGQVLVSEMAATKATNSDDPKTGLKNAYTFTGTADDLAECYISDLVTVNKAGTAGIGEVTGYNQPVKLKFRQLGTKVRIGLYETVPGYSVKNVEFYSAAASNDANAAAAKIFTTVANGIYKEGTYTVYFPTVDKPTDADNNQAHIKFAPKANTAQKTTVEWGTLDYTIRESGESSQDEIYLGRTSNTASFAGDAANNYYVVYLPNQTGTNLNLRVNYTLESIDGSQELIVVKGATAQVPLIYTQWKPGYAYTYLFKISDKTNGHTGEYNPLYPDDLTVNSDPAGLYPITFDAVVVNAEEGATNQETITTISTPSITTYQKGSKVVNQNEYDHATGPIFVTVNDGVSSYELVSGLTSTSSVAGYFTKTTINEYGQASGVAQNGVTYFTDANGTEANPQPTVGTELGDNYYIITSSKDIYTSASGTYQDGTDYYRMITTAESGKLATLTNSGNGMAALYTLPTDKAYTEADVVDAMQMQDDDAADNTVKGRSGLVMTKADFSLVEEIEYGVDGNVINLKGLPNPTGTGTYDANAMKFTATAAGTYAFVYTKKAATGDGTIRYEALAWDAFGTGATKYSYDYLPTTASPVYTDDKGTPDENDDETTSYYDAQKGVKYYTRTGAGTDASPYAYTRVSNPFIGQGVSNLYLDNQGNTIAKGYAVSGVDYYYTVDGGLHYIKAENVAIAAFAEATNIGTGNTNETWAAKDASLTKPADNTAYYKRTGTGTEQDPYVYTYCVFLPQQVNGKYVIDTDHYRKATESSAVDGMTYFDKYIKNNGVYYTKVIKVQ